MFPASFTPTWADDFHADYGAVKASGMRQNFEIGSDRTDRRHDPTKPEVVTWLSPRTE